MLPVVRHPCLNSSALHHAVIFYHEVAEAICYALWKGKSTLIKFSITFQGHLRVFHSLHTLFNAFLGLKLLDFQVIRIPRSYSLRIRSINLQLRQGLVLLVTVTLYVSFDHPFMCLSNSGLQEALRQSRLWKGLQCVAGVAQRDRYPYTYTHS